MFFKCSKNFPFDHFVFWKRYFCECFLNVLKTFHLIILYFGNVTLECFLNVLKTSHLIILYFGNVTLECFLNVLKTFHLIILYFGNVTFEYFFKCSKNVPFDNFVFWKRYF